MITVPTVTPVTRPEAETVAFELLALQTPPPTASVREILELVATLESPVIVPAELPVTLTVVVAVVEPQLFVVV